MSLRILFADDSVTAQNMGKKILTEAGYDVVAVSNGAAAVKKIAEQKPDIIILDLYMPGYSGLEVCEKVRASISTIKTPVLLTVGKMEPYKPEDANRVRADGVIIKPFEASDLLAIMKKFEERIAQAIASAPPPPPPTEQIPVLAPEPPVEHPEPAMKAPMQPMVEVPDHMATSSAFSDLLGSDAAHAVDHYNVAAPQRVPEQAPSSATVVAAASLPDYEIPVWRQEPAPAPVQVAPEVVESPAPVALPVESESAEPQEAPPRPRLIPVFHEPGAQQPHDFLPTAAPPLGDIDIPREPHLQETAEETTRNTIAEAREPGLIPTLHQANEHPVEERGVAEFAPEPEMPLPAVNAAAQLPVTAPLPAPEFTQQPSTMVASTTTSESDFETRVAAAMAAYNHPPETLAEPAIEPPAPQTPPAAVAPPSFQAPTVGPAQPPVEYHPPAAEANHHEAAPAEVAEPVQETAPPPEPEIRHEDIAAKVETELPAAAAAAAAQAGATAEDHETIAQAVHRVMDRVKGDLVEEILRELKSKK
ncbi:MAG TPA: response regulator [Candidatus Angelobacter sp.]